MSKKDAQLRHARRRARERYGIELGNATRSFMLAAIHRQRSRFVERQSLRITVHDVTMADGQIVRVVYDRIRKELVTCLPRETEGEASGY